MDLNPTKASVREVLVVQPTLKGIAIRARSRAPMQELTWAQISLAQGVIGDARGRPGKRQLTLLAEPAWHAACEQLNVFLPWHTRRANLLISGIEFSPTMVGSRVVIGTVILQITRETNPCARMNQACMGLREALTPSWRGGVCAKVIEPGRIEVGDRVEFK